MSVVANQLKVKRLIKKRTVIRIKKMPKKMKIFCIHFAGGNKYSYKSLVEKAPEGMELISLELPGRGGRTNEFLISDMESAVEDLFQQIKGQLSEPYAIFGHSMGALLGFLLAHKIQAHNLPLPKNLLLTGRQAPSIPLKGVPGHLLPKPALIKRLATYGGKFDFLLNEPELLDYFLPVIRKDFQIIETYRHESVEKLNVPITVVTGTEEAIDDAAAQAWAKETTRGFNFLKMEGKHFFIFDHEEALIELMTSVPAISISTYGNENYSPFASSTYTTKAA